MGAGWAPLLRSITLTQNVAAQLLAKLAALDANFPARLSYLVIEYDSLLATGNLYIGNSGVAANNCGAHLVAGQDKNVLPFDTGVILTADVYLLSDSAINQVNIVALPIGM